MTEQASQLEYWNSRAEHMSSLDAPLIPGQQDIDFMRKHLVPGGHSLILGVTPQLCSIALEVSDTVTSVDFAEDMIKVLGNEDVRYICEDWNQFFDRSPDQFDNIVTDGGLTCLEFPDTWQQIASNISQHLLPNGIFSARVFINTPEPPKKNYENPNLNRFVSGMARVDHNWMLKVETGDDYKDYDVRYAFPPDQEVLRTFGRLTLRDKFIPSYEEGKHFVSYAWQRPAK